MKSQAIDKNIFLEIIIQLLGTFKALHDTRRTYNDLKLANIMINQVDANQFDFKNLQTTLIDFGFSHTYVDHKGIHVRADSTVEKF